MPAPQGEDPAGPAGGQPTLPLLGPRGLGFLSSGPRAQLLSLPGLQAAAAAKRALPIATARPQRQGRRPAIVEVSESEGDEEPEAHSDEESDFVAEEGAEEAPKKGKKK